MIKWLAVEGGANPLAVLAHFARATGIAGFVTVPQVCASVAGQVHGHREDHDGQRLKPDPAAGTGGKGPSWAVEAGTSDRGVLGSILDMKPSERVAPPRIFALLR